jgi:hypothetical protein
VPSKQINWLYTAPAVPWLVAFSILFIIAWSGPTRPIYAILMLVLFTSQNAAQMVYNCFPDLPDGNHKIVLNYSRRRCMNNKLALIAAALVFVAIVVKKAWR